MPHVNKFDTTATTTTAPASPATATVQTTTSTIHHPQRTTHLSFQLQPSDQHKTDKDNGPIHSPILIPIPVPNPIKDYPTWENLTLKHLLLVQTGWSDAEIEHQITLKWIEANARVTEAEIRARGVGGGVEGLRRWEEVLAMTSGRSI